MNKLEISDNLKNEIYDKYINGMSIRKLETQYPYSFTFLQKLIHSYKYDESISNNYPVKNDYDLIAVCKLTNKEFYDYLNVSGAITSHVFKHYPEESKKSKYVRKSIEYTTGKFWYDQYFDFIYKSKKEIKKCFYCEWETNDINNLSGSYEKHLKLEHNKSVKDYLLDNPSDKDFFKNLEPENGVTCLICGKKMELINSKHLKTHNLTVSEYKMFYSTNTSSEESKKKQIKQWETFLKDLPFSKQSSHEKEIIDQLSNVNFITSDRKILNGLEIDLYDPIKKIGVEINGLYYHSEISGKKNNKYHLNKSLLCHKNDISLIQIFEDEIINKKDIVISKLKHIFGISLSKKINGRDVSLKKIDNTLTNEFLEKYHIQGYSKSSINIGAYYDNTLVAVMCFDNKRLLNKEKNHNENIYELTRFATHSEYIIRGIASKILTFFIREYKPERIISFADRRWTPNPNKNLYVSLGFKLTKILKPDYKYYLKKSHRSGRFHKFGFGKNNLKKRFPHIYDDNKTEWEMMQELGYDRIWDCGKFKYELYVNQ